MTVFLNFIFFALYLSFIFTHELLRAGHQVSSQLSILILIFSTAIFAFAGKWLVNAVERIEDDSLRIGAQLSTYIWAGHALDLVFEPSTRLSALSFIPLAIILISRYRPTIWRARNFTPLLVGFSIIAQIASMALILKIGGDFSAAFGIAGILWLIYAIVASRLFSRISDDGWSMALTFGQALPFAWFFLNFSNQVVSYSSTASGLFLVLAVLAVLAFAATIAVQAFARLSENVYGLINRIALLLFGFSQLINFSFVHIIGQPLSESFGGGGGGHFWFKIHCGLETIYSSYKPFVNYIPTEGVFFQVYWPRIIFEYMDMSLGGYFVSLFLAGLVSFALFLFITSRSFVQGLSMKWETALFITFAIAITNIIPVQLYGGGPEAYWWVTIERMPMLFISFIAFHAYNEASQMIADGEKGRNWRFYFTGFILGAVHTLSILFEPTFGIGCLVGLFAVFAIRPFSAKGIGMVIIGGVLTALMYTIVFNIPAVNFFYHHPKGLLSFGKELVDNYSSLKSSMVPGAEFKPHHQIFDAITRSRIFLTLHSTLLLLAIIIFLTSLPYGARKHRHFSMALYLGFAMFTIFISRGQKFTGVFMGPYTNIIHMSMALPLLPAFVGYTMSVWSDVNHDQVNSRKKFGYGIIALTLVLVFANGINLGLKYSHPAWIPLQKNEHAHLLSRSLPEAFEHVYKYLGREKVSQIPKTHKDFIKPYSEIKEIVAEQANIRLLSITPPYEVDTLCPDCPMKAELLGVEDNKVYGENVVFNWTDVNAYEYVLHIGHKKGRGTEWDIYGRSTSATHLNVTNLPGDGQEIFVALLVRNKSGMTARSEYYFTSMPARPATDDNHTSPAQDLPQAKP